MDKNNNLVLKGGKAYRTKPFAAWPEYGQEEIDAVTEVVKSGIWSRASYTNHLKYCYESKSNIGRFEKVFTDFIGTKHGIFINSGTSALHLAFKVLDLEEGSEVITTPYTFFSTTIPVYENRLKPVFVDVDENGNIDADKIEEKITDKTKAVLIMHCAGYPCKMDVIRDVCNRYNLFLVQDCAHAVCAEYDNKHVSTYGDISIFSFEASKNLNSGEGGFITMDDDQLFERAYSIQSCGRPVGGQWRTHIYTCENYRPSEFQGALALQQLKRVKEQQKRREESMNYLNNKLKDNSYFKAISLNGKANSHGAYSYVILIKEVGRKKLTGKRLAIYLEMEGIPCHSGYNNLIFDVDYAKQFTSESERKQMKNECPRACEFLKYSIWIPQTILISDLEDVKDVIGALDKIAKNVFERR